MPKIIKEYNLKDVDDTLKLLVDYFLNKYNTNVVINSGGRSYARQVEIYKEKFGDDWENEIPLDSAHVFNPGKGLCY